MYWADIYDFGLECASIANAQMEKWSVHGCRHRNPHPYDVRCPSRGFEALRGSETVVRSLEELAAEVQLKD
eukprot:708825-Amphidinium_carterae.1